jgi:hypothetical protein
MAQERSLDEESYDHIADTAVELLHKIEWTQPPIEKTKEILHDISALAGIIRGQESLGDLSAEIERLLPIRSRQEYWNLFRRTYEDWLVRRHGLEARQASAILDRVEAADLPQGHVSLLCRQIHFTAGFRGPSAIPLLLDREDLGRLCARMEAAVYLSWDLSPPLCSLSELAALTGASILHLKRNREALIETGCSATSFDRHSSWLDWFVRHLYPTKRACWPGDKASLRADWSCVGGASDNGEEPVVANEERALIEGLSSEDAARLEAGRPRLFGLKVAVLREVIHALTIKNAYALWDNSLRLLKEAMNAGDVDFYLSMDRLYMSYDATTSEEVYTQRSGPERGVTDAPGGLTNVLQLMGYYEKELTLGTVYRTVEAAGNLIGEDEHGRRSFVEHYQVSGTGKAEVLDISLDLFLSLRGQEQVVWNAYYQKVTDALAREFKSVPRATPQIVSANSQGVRAKCTEEVVWSPDRGKLARSRHLQDYWLKMMNERFISSKRQALQRLPADNELVSALRKALDRWAERDWRGMLEEMEMFVSEQFDELLEETPIAMRHTLMRIYEDVVPAFPPVFVFRNYGEIPGYYDVIVGVSSYATSEDLKSIWPWIMRQREEVGVKPEAGYANFTRDLNWYQLRLQGKSLREVGEIWASKEADDFRADLENYRAKTDEEISEKEYLRLIYPKDIFAAVKRFKKKIEEAYS